MPILKASAGLLAARRRSGGGGGGGSTYDVATLALAPDSYWKLNEASGTTFADSSVAASHPLSLHGSGATRAVSTGLTGAPLGCHLGASAWAIRTSALAQPNGHAACSYAGWFNYVSGSAHPYICCASYSGGHSDPYYIFLMTGDGSPGHWQGVVDTTGTLSYTTFGGSITSGWNHLALVYDGTNFNHYLNGSLNAAVAHTGNVHDTMGSFAINNIPALDSSSYACDLAASSVGYWSNHALSSGEVAGLYAAR